MKKFKLNILGFEDRYLIDKAGNIYTTPNRYRGFRSEALKPRKTHNGYHRVILAKEGKIKNMFVHRLVALTFLQNPKNLPFVNHKNGNKTDNNVDNIEWTTSQDNSTHAVNSGLIKSSLNSDKVALIKKLLKTTKGSMLAEQFGVSCGTISQINTGKTWRQI